MRYDCVTFYQYLEALRTAEDAKESYWLNHDLADPIFKVSFAM